MPKPVISVEHLTKKYDLGVIGTGTLTRDFERWWARVRGKPDPFTRIGQEDRFKKLGESILALDDISFSVNQGETLGIIGKNGAGKSTLLKILSRVTAPTSGVVKVKGRIGSLLEVGTGFHPELTGRENVYLNGAILGMKKAEVARKFDEIVDFSGVEKFIDTPVKRYSSGMYVRLAFAVAAHLDPEILIVDEVLAVGDAEFQKKCLGKMGDVAYEGRTVLFVSHSMDSIKTLCKSCIWLKDGKQFAEGESENVVTKYLSDNHAVIQPSISDRVDRTGNGLVRFTSCSINQMKTGQRKTFYYTGDAISITVKIESRINTRIFIGLALKDMNGRTITSFNSREGAYPASIQEGMNIIVLSIPWLLLLEGTYTLDGALVSAINSASHDRISNISTISVYPNDNFRAGASFRAYHGITFIPHKWSSDFDEEVVVFPPTMKEN